MLALALAGGAQYIAVGDTAPALRTWSAGFPEEHVNGPGGAGSAPDGQTSTGSVNLNRTNITEAAFQFQFTDTYRFSTLSPAGATFKVTSPLGLTGEATLSPGQATAAIVTVPRVCDAPDPEEFNAKNDSEAARIVKARYPANENGTGDWTIEVTVTRDYRTPVHPAGGIAWTVTTRLTVYSLDLRERLSA
jgi:hypothetical protein